MIIRQAASMDVKSIRSLLGQLGYPDFDEADVAQKIAFHKADGYHMLVAEMDGIAVAFASLHWFELAHWHGKMGRVTSFCVDEKFRSRGIGGQLLRTCEDILSKAGCIKIEVTSNIRRARAHAFYLKSGYEEDSRRFVKILGNRGPV